MPVFPFKLAAVLRHRTAIEQEKQRLHALALAQFKDLEDQLKALNQSMQATNDDIRQNQRPEKRRPRPPRPRRSRQAKKSPRKTPRNPGRALEEGTLTQGNDRRR